jgi:hypothetical protein
VRADFDGQLRPSRGRPHAADLLRQARQATETSGRRRPRQALRVHGRPRPHGPSPQLRLQPQQGSSSTAAGAGQVDEGVGAEVRDDQGLKT